MIGSLNYRLYPGDYAATPYQRIVIVFRGGGTFRTTIHRNPGPLRLYILQEDRDGLLSYHIFHARENVPVEYAASVLERRATWFELSVHADELSQILAISENGEYRWIHR